MKSFLQTWRIEIFCILLTILSVTGIWMKALDKKVQEKGVRPFSIMKLELPETADSLKATLDSVETKQAAYLVKRNLHVDFAFMPAAYIGIAFWLLLIRKNTRRWLRWMLLLVAALQVLPWVLDIIENKYLLDAVKDPAHQIGMNIDAFKQMVKIKFIVALGGAAIALLTCIYKAFASNAGNETKSVA